VAADERARRPWSQNVDAKTIKSVKVTGAKPEGKGILRTLTQSAFVRAVTAMGALSV